MRRTGTIVALVGLACVEAVALACAAPAPNSSANAVATPDRRVSPSTAAAPSPVVRTSTSPSPSPSPAAGAVVSIAPGGASRANAPLDRDTLVSQAQADAATRAGVALDAVRVARVESREWPNSGLGCARPGVAYAQVITPGYLIVVEAGGQTLEYHADRTRAELCNP